MYQQTSSIKRQSNQKSLSHLLPHSSSSNKINEYHNDHHHQYQNLNSTIKNQQIQRNTGNINGCDKGKDEGGGNLIEKRLIHYIPSLIHDLRNPLQQLYACIELYKLQLNSIQNPLYEILSQSITHMNELISKALTTFQRIIECKNEESINEIKYQNVDINKYLEEFWTNNLAIAEQKQNVDYQILVQSTLPHQINIPKLEVTQIIQNLFSNATKFTEKGSIKLIVSFHELFENENDDQLTPPQECKNKSSSDNQINQNYNKFENGDINNFHSNGNSLNQKIQSNLLSTKNSIQAQKEIDVNQGKFQQCLQSKQFAKSNQLTNDELTKQRNNTNNQYLDIQQNAGKEDQDYQSTPISCRQTALSVQISEPNKINQASFQHKFSSVTNLCNQNEENLNQIGFQRLLKKLQRITYQFDKLKYSQQQDNDDYRNTEEAVEEDYNESDQVEHSAKSVVKGKQIDGFSEYYQYNNLNPNNENEKQKKYQRSQIPINSQISNNLNYPQNQQGNGTTPNNSLNNNGNVTTAESNQHNQIPSNNQIENSYTFSTSRSYHNSTPPTFQIHTFSDLQNQYHTPQMNPKNQFQSLKYNGFNSSDQPHNLKNINSGKAQISHSQSQNNINKIFVKEIKDNNFQADYPSPDRVSVQSNSKIESQPKNNQNNNNNMNSFSSDLNCDNQMQNKNSISNINNNFYNQESHKKRLSTVIPLAPQFVQENKCNPYFNLQNNNNNNKIPASAELEGQSKSQTLSTIMKQQQLSKQNKTITQNGISNSYYYNFQQKQNSQSSTDLRSLKKQTQEPQNNLHPQSNQINERLQTDKQKQTQNNQKNVQDTSINVKTHPHSTFSSVKLPNNNEFCQIFSKRKSQIHPSIRDLVFSRNNIRNYQLRQVASIKGYLKFEILDTGRGMTQEEQKHIFDIYQQANSSIKEQYGGTGIGLYSAKNIALQLHGDIFCHSLKGVGSAFIFYMPCEATFKTDKSPDVKERAHKNELNCNFIQYQSKDLVFEDDFSKKKYIPNQNNFEKKQNEQYQSNQQNKPAFEKQQQLQIIQINEGLKSADTLNHKFEQQNQLIRIKQTSSNPFFSTKISPADQKKEELNKLILQLEEKKKTIDLIYIDDNQFLLTTMQKLLSQIKCIKLTAEISAVNSLATIKSNPNQFQIALIDNDMPEISGTQLAQQIKSINPNIVLICHSGYPNTEDFQKECTESGFSYFLEKPCTFQSILHLLAKIYDINYSQN